MNIDQEDTGFSTKKRLMIGGFVLVVLACWFSWSFYLLGAGKFSFDKELDSFGQVGDSFGALNALFSALAFLAVFVALLVQQRELKEQIAEARNANKSFEAQVGALQQQSFDSMYMQLLAMLEATRNKFTRSIHPDIDNSNYVFHKRANQMKQHMRESGKAGNSLSPSEYMEIVGRPTFLTHRAEFRNYEHTFDAAFNMALGGETKYSDLYLNLLFANLSDDELLVLFNRAVVLAVEHEDTTKLDVLKRLHPLSTIYRHDYEAEFKSFESVCSEAFAVQPITTDADCEQS